MRNKSEKPEEKEYLVTAYRVVNQSATIRVRATSHKDATAIVDNMHDEELEWDNEYFDFAGNPTIAEEVPPLTRRKKKRAKAHA